MNYSDHWPSDSKIKPYFLFLDDLFIQNAYKKFIHHPYLIGSKEIFVLFIIGLDDIIEFKKYKSKNCKSDHAQIKFPRNCKIDTVKKVQNLIDQMNSIKKKFESTKNLYIGFSYVPDVTFVNDVNNISFASKQDNCTCSCPIEKAKYKAFICQFNLIRNTVNQFIFSKKLTEIRNKGFFEFLPLKLNYVDRKWKIHKSRLATKVDGISLNAKLNNFVFPSPQHEIVTHSSKIIEDDLILIRRSLLGKLNFKIIIIGDTWLESILENWSSQYKLKPFFYCKNNLTLEGIKEIIFSLVKDNFNTLIITFVPSGELFSFENYPYCSIKNHKSLTYPVPKKNILITPIKHAHYLSEKVKLLQAEMKKFRKYCKVAFITCYPVLFEFYYKYLVKQHSIDTKPSHNISKNLVSFSSCVEYQTKLDRCLKEINSELSQINIINGFPTCDIYSLISKLVLDKLIFPVYVPHKSPPPMVLTKLVKLIGQYIENISAKFMKNNLSLDFTKKSTVMKTKDTVTESSHSDNSIINKNHSFDKGESSNKKSFAKPKSPVNNRSSKGKVEQANNSDACTDEIIVKSLTCSSIPKKKPDSIQKIITGNREDPSKMKDFKRSQKSLITIIGGSSHSKVNDSQSSFTNLPEEVHSNEISQIKDLPIMPLELRYPKDNEVFHDRLEHSNERYSLSEIVQSLEGNNDMNREISGNYPSSLENKKG